MQACAAAIEKSRILILRATRVKAAQRSRGQDPFCGCNLHDRMRLITDWTRKLEACKTIPAPIENEVTIGPW